jgi:hypothetical protein
MRISGYSAVNSSSRGISQLMPSAGGVVILRSPLENHFVRI